MINNQCVGYTFQLFVDVENCDRESVHVYMHVVHSWFVVEIIHNLVSGHIYLHLTWYNTGVAFYIMGLSVKALYSELNKYNL